MNKLESLKLFKELQLVSEKYRNLTLRDEENEISDNNKLNSILIHYQSKLDDIRKRSNFISVSTREELKGCSPQDISNVLFDLNSFAHQKYNSLKNSDIKSTTFKAVMFTTVDELLLINESISSKEYLNDQNTYFYIYEKILINAFMNFLALKDMDMEDELINSFSQGVFTQLKTLSIISM